MTVTPEFWACKLRESSGTFGVNIWGKLRRGATKTRINAEESYGTGAIGCAFTESGRKGSWAMTDGGAFLKGSIYLRAID